MCGAGCSWRSENATPTRRGQVNVIVNNSVILKQRKLRDGHNRAVTFTPLTTIYLHLCLKYFTLPLFHGIVAHYIRQKGLMYDRDIQKE